ncbi:MAG: hypothetical protein O2945_21420 [Planctomycetota bacterium]|nr:hypothetical protein [Planctomycetota bacterium]
MRQDAPYVTRKSVNECSWELTDERISCSTVPHLQLDRVSGGGGLGLGGGLIQFGLGDAGGEGFGGEGGQDVVVFVHHVLVVADHGGVGVGIGDGGLEAGDLFGAVAVFELL